MSVDAFAFRVKLRTRLLPGTVVSELERFVIAGGGLFVTLGDRVQIDAYNRDLYRQGKPYREKAN